jgi:hypothetical protein
LCCQISGFGKCIKLTFTHDLEIKNYGPALTFNIKIECHFKRSMVILNT